MCNGAVTELVACVVMWYHVSAGALAGSRVTFMTPIGPWDVLGEMSKL